MVALSCRSLAHGGMDDDGSVTIALSRDNGWRREGSYKDDDSISEISYDSASTIATASPVTQTAATFEDVPMTSTVDVYGQRHPIESSQLIAAKLKQFADHLRYIDNAQKVALTEAERRCPNLLTDDFKLMFLRCECFNVTKAAKRYVTYWAKRLEVFGPERAFQDISMNAIPRDETRMLENGAIMILQRSKSASIPSAVKSRSNDEEVEDTRDMVYLNASRLSPKEYPRAHAVRCFWSLMHTLLLDEQVQKRGLILLVNVDHFHHKNRDPMLAAMLASAVVGCLPIRMSACHMCHATAFHLMLFQFIFLFIGERMRSRYRAHRGSYETVTNLLETKFGIPRHCIPTHIGGDCDVDSQDPLQPRQAAQDSSY